MNFEMTVYVTLLILRVTMGGKGQKLSKIELYDVI